MGCRVDTSVRGLEARTSIPAVARVLPRADVVRDALGAPASVSRNAVWCFLARTT